MLHVDIKFIDNIDNKAKHAFSNTAGIPDPRLQFSLGYVCPSRTPSIRDQHCAHVSERGRRVVESVQ